MRESGRVSPADQFAIVIGLLADAIERGNAPAHVDVPALVGPPEAPPGSGARRVPWTAFRDAVGGAADEMRARAHVPARVFVGAVPVAPADFLRAAAIGRRGAARHRDRRRFPRTRCDPQRGARGHRTFRRRGFAGAVAAG